MLWSLAISHLVVTGWSPVHSRKPNQLGADLAITHRMNSLPTKEYSLGWPEGWEKDTGISNPKCRYL